MINFTDIPRVFVGLIVSFVCALNIILYEASLSNSSISVIPQNPYLLAALLSCSRFIMFIGTCLYLRLNTTLTKDEYICLILAGIFTGVFRVCTFLSVNDTNSSIYANYSNIDILMFWIIDYLNLNIKSQHVKLDCLIMLAIVICSFLANNLISPFKGNLTSFNGCILAIVATFAGVLGITCYSKTSKSNCSKSYRCGIMFLTECLACAMFIPLGVNTDKYNNIIYVLFIANLCLAFTSYTVIDTFGMTFLAVNMALIIIWSYLYVLCTSTISNISGSFMATILLFVLVIIYNMWKEYSTNHTYDELPKMIKSYRTVRFEDEKPLIKIDTKSVKNYLTNINDDNVV